jgi:raffinose/stachyose/melibiose transport system permease protein
LLLKEKEETIQIKKEKKFNIRKYSVHLFLLPALLFYTIFQVYPIFSALLNSFYSFKGFHRDEFIGLENFIVLFTESPHKE